MADEAQLAGPGLWHWQAYEPAVKADLSSSALVLEAKVYFVDPIPLADAALEELTRFARPAGVILTSANHHRAAAHFRERFGVPLLAHPAAGEGATIDVALAEGAEIGEGICVLEIPGAAAGEIALHSAAGEGLLVVGDALINLEPHGFGFLPDKYCADPVLMRRSLRRLLDLKFQMIAFAHGLPIVARAQQRLGALLEC